MSRVLAPIETVDFCDCVAGPSGRRVECGACCKVYCQGSVVTGEPRWDEGLGGKVVGRAAYCDHCGHVQRWLEGWLNGRPTGEVIGKPVVVSDRKQVELFLRAHPEARGVVQV